MGSPVDARYPLCNISNSSSDCRHNEVLISWHGKKGVAVGGGSSSFQNPKRAKKLLHQAFLLPRSTNEVEVEVLSGVEFEPQIQHSGDLPSFHPLAAKDHSQEIADGKSSEGEGLSEEELEPQLEQSGDLPNLHPVITTDHSEEIADWKSNEVEVLSDVELEPQLEQPGDLPDFHPLTTTDHSREITETPTKIASDHEHNATPSTPRYHTPAWLDHPKNLQEVSICIVSKPKVNNTCKKNREEVMVMSCPQLYRNHRSSVRGRNSETIESCQKNPEQLLHASSIQGGSTFSKKSSSRRKSLPASFVHRQNSYFAEVDAFELEEEEATSEPE